MSILEIRNVKKCYDLGRTSVIALEGIKLTIEKGEFLTIVGPSGSGKSTMLNLMGLLDKPTSGEIFINGRETATLREGDRNRIRSREIGFIFQAFNLIPVLDVFENIELPLLLNRTLGKPERRDLVLHFMEEVGLSRQRTQLPGELSGGQRQRVAVARALATRPLIVLADEPTANLDSKTGLEIIDLMHGINQKEHTTFIFSSHDPKVYQRAERIITLMDGQLVPGADHP